jgi:hypothetical protein
MDLVLIVLSQRELKVSRIVIAMALLRLSEDCTSATGAINQELHNIQELQSESFLLKRK